MIHEYIRYHVFVEKVDWSTTTYSVMLKNDRIAEILSWMRRSAYLCKRKIFL